MKLRILFFYFSFVAVASVITVAVFAGVSMRPGDVLQMTQKQNATLPAGAALSSGEKHVATEMQKNDVPACMNDMRCPDCNVILLSVDSLRADHVGAYGYERDATPFFDEIAKNGVLFENFFSSSFLTPVSEMAVHTGMYPSATMVTNFDTVLPEDRMTIAQHFKQNGYATSALLSSPEFDINPALRESFSRGFEQYEYIKREPPISLNDFRAFPGDTQIEAEMKKIADKKFFWWVGIGGVHWPYRKQEQNVFADANYTGIFKDAPLTWAEFQNVYEGVDHHNKMPLSDADIQYVQDHYDNGVRAFDGFLERFINELKQQNLFDSTLIVIQSEHGEDLHEHGYFAHYDILDTQTHVPLMIISPRFERGCRITSFAGSVDIFPTILEMTEHEQLSQFQGKSLAPIISGDEGDGARQEVFLERNPLWEETETVKIGFEARGIIIGEERHNDIGIRTPQWKYIDRMSNATMKEISWWQMISGKQLYFPEAELYDLVNDPMETKNVVDQYPKQAAMLRKKLQIWFSWVTATSKSRVDKRPVMQPYF
ncbi:MAG: sulfatase-like hydrolase/transferase [Patescibacteria group bacterium]